MANAVNLVKDTVLEIMHNHKIKITKESYIEFLKDMRQKTTDQDILTVVDAELERVDV